MPNAAFNASRSSEQPPEPRGKVSPLGSLLEPCSGCPKRLPKKLVFQKRLTSMRRPPHSCASREAGWQRDREIHRKAGKDTSNRLTVRPISYIMLTLKNGEAARAALPRAQSAWNAFAMGTAAITGRCGFAQRGLDATSWRLFVGLARIRYIAAEHAGRRR